jgi:hypothetical protein
MAFACEKKLFDSCPLPPWPSVTREQIERFAEGSICRMMGTSEAADAIQCFLKSIGVEVKEVRDEKP